MSQQLSHEVATSVTQASHASLNHLLANLPTFLHVSHAYEHLIQAAADTTASTGRESSRKDVAEVSLKLDGKEHSTATCTTLLRAFQSLPAHHGLELESIRLRPSATSRAEPEGMTLNTDHDDQILHFLLHELACNPTEVRMRDVSCCLQSWQSIIVALASNPNLQTLEVGKCAESEDADGHLRFLKPAHLSDLTAGLLERLVSLRSLRLDQPQPPGLTTALSHHTQLTCLSITTSNLVPEQLAPVIKRLGCLQHLQLEFRTVNICRLSEHAIQLGESVGKLTALSKLAISFRDCIRDGIELDLLSFRNRKEPFADVMMRKLERLRKLRSLSLDQIGKPMTRANMAMFCTFHVQILRKLTALRLWVEGVDPCIIRVCRTLKDAAQLTELKLQWQCLYAPESVTNVRKLCTELYTISSLHSLDIQYSSIGELIDAREESAVSEGVAIPATLPSLSRLSLHCPDAFLQTPELLKSAKLKQLQLVGAAIVDPESGSRCNGRCSSMIRRGCDGSNVQQLTLERCGMNEADSKVVGAFVACLTCLTFLDLNDAFNSQRVGSVREFFSAVPKLSSLRHLAVSMEGLFKDDAVALGATLMGMRELVVLRVQLCSLRMYGPGAAVAEHSEQGAEVLMQAISCLQKLTHLELSDILMSDRSAKALAGSLRQLTGLKDLNLDGSDVATEVLLAGPLVSSLKQAEGLTCLNLYTGHPVRRFLGAEGAAVVGELLRTVTALRRVLVNKIDIDAEGAEVLLAALPEDDPLRCAELTQMCHEVARAGRMPM